jgi:hypothetical protein
VIGVNDGSQANSINNTPVIGVVDMDQPFVIANSIDQIADLN